MCYVTYWGIKSTRSFEGILKKYLNEMGKVILDPYGGSGTIIEFILRHGKRAIYNDINPIAYLVAKYNITFSGNDAEDLMRCLTIIRGRLSYLNDLYREYCPYCNNVSNVMFRIYENGEATSYLSCGHAVKSGDVEYPTPKWALAPLSYGTKPFLKVKRNLTITDLFTRRNLIILDELRKILPECPDVIKYVMIPIIYLSSRMTHIPKDKEELMLRGKRWLPSWALPAYWLPGRFIELNPLELIERRIKTMLTCKRRKYVVGNVDDVLRKKADVAFLNTDSSELPIPNDSVDIITDPPYPTDIQYGELYFLHAVILNIPYNDVFLKELIVNKNRGLTINDYLNMFSKHLSELYRVNRKYAIFIIKDNTYLGKIIDSISRYFYVQGTEEVTIKKRRSRIGDYKDEYRYKVIVSTKQR